MTNTGRHRDAVGERLPWTRRPRPPIDWSGPEWRLWAILSLVELTLTVYGFSALVGLDARGNAFLGAVDLIAAIASGALATLYLRRPVKARPSPKPARGQLILRDR